ncbi:MAG: hypothetical protein ACKVH8_14920 [Pirellulales bacterium]
MSLSWTFQSIAKFFVVDHPSYFYFTYEFPLLNHLLKSFKIDAELDCILFMENTPQTWCSSWLYTNDVKQAETEFIE